MLEAISCTAAKENGLMWYFTSKPCPRGHICERSVLNRSCKECSKLAGDNWRARNRTKIAEYHRARYLENPEPFKAKSNLWAQNNPEKVRAGSKLRKQKLRELQAGRARPDFCEVCSRKPTGRGAIHWDHSHTSNQFRGWLCSKCNMALGLVDDNPDILRKLTTYLERQT